MTSRLRAAYRSLIREARRLDSSPRVGAKRDISKHFRVAVDGQKQGANNGPYDETIRVMDNAALFLRSQRIHKELLERYNPLHGMTQAERTVATARRVGLNMPIERKLEESEKK